MFMMLKNKVAIVTGGTRGIGFAVVKKFIENGAAVSLWGSRQETVDQALEQLKELYPDAKISGKYPSLKDTAQVTAMINQVKEEFGAVDILVNNAGISQSTSFYNYQPEEFQKIVDLNVTAVFNCSQALAKIMKEQGGRRNLEYKLYGEYLWATIRMWISCIEICCKWIDKVSGKRTWL